MCCGRSACQNFRPSGSSCIFSSFSSAIPDHGKEFEDESDNHQQRVLKLKKRPADKNGHKKHADTAEQSEEQEKETRGNRVERRKEKKISLSIHALVPVPSSFLLPFLHYNTPKAK